MDSKTITYDGTALRLRGPARLLDGVVQALAPFFDSRGEGAVLATIVAHPEAFPAGRFPLEGEGETVAVDTSLYPHLASSGRRWEDDERIVVRIDLGSSWLSIDKRERVVDLWQPDSARLEIELQRTIKSLMTPALERSGAVQCHCAGVTLKGEPSGSGAVLLFGDMWQGKTTVLLELLAEFEIRQLSCDTTVIRATAEGARVRGWPSPFSMSHGTMSDHPQLHPFIPEERRKLPYDRLWKDGLKSVLTSAEVVQRFGTSIDESADRVRAAVHLRFQTDGPIGIEQLVGLEPIREAIRETYLGSRDPIYHNWHRWISCPDEVIEANIAAVASSLAAAVPFYRISWAPSVTSLLKRIDCLASAHKHLGRLNAETPLQERSKAERSPWSPA